MTSLATGLPWCAGRAGRAAGARDRAPAGRGRDRRAGHVHPAQPLRAAVLYLGSAGARRGGECPVHDTPGRCWGSPSRLRRCWAPAGPRRPEGSAGRPGQPAQTGRPATASSRRRSQVDNRMFRSAPHPVRLQGRSWKAANPRHTACLHGHRPDQGGRRRADLVAWDATTWRAHCRNRNSPSSPRRPGNLWNFGEYRKNSRTGNHWGTIPGSGSRALTAASTCWPGPRLACSTARTASRRSGSDDLSRVVSTTPGDVCPPRVLPARARGRRMEPGQPGSSVKYYAPGVGLVRVARGAGNSQEFLG